MSCAIRREIRESIAKMTGETKKVYPDIRCVIRSKLHPDPVHVGLTEEANRLLQEGQDRVSKPIFTAESLAEAKKRYQTR